MKNTAITLIILLLSSATVSAEMYAEHEMACPICQTEFKTTVAISGTTFNVRLDLKQLGAIASPSPVPVCPSCSFVVYGRGIPEDEIKACRTIVKERDYSRHSGRSPYYLMALLFEKLKKGDLEIADAYLQASWQEEESPEKLKEDQEKSLSYFKKYLADVETQDEAWQTAQMLSGELLRRLGKFGDAEALFLKLAKMNGFQEDPISQIVQYQLKLVGKHDSGPHTIAEATGGKPYRDSSPSERTNWLSYAIAIVALLGVAGIVVKLSRRRRKNLEPAAPVDRGQAPPTEP